MHHRHHTVRETSHFGGRLATPTLTFRPSKRIQQSMLAGVEKRFLIWLAERMPAWVGSDHLTALGFMAMIFTGLSYWYSRWDRLGLLLVIFWLAVNWFGDSLDGTLARVRRRLRPRYGFYVDHIVDAFGTAALFGGMALSGYLSWPVAAALLVVYFMLCIEIYLATYTIGDFHLDYAGFGPTELRIVIAIGNLALFSGYDSVGVLGQRYKLFDVGGMIAAFGMGMVLVYASVRHTIQLYREERLP
ncbi:MAG: CDP-alcohol phosphatidyltransferase family protein [Acidobacteriales bacterium]|nr:CDP-alcohol phosphatidyltransferase family protein [Terriglobales bacterium]